MRTLPVALTIAGSDSSGGAGIQADLKTFTAMGVYGESCITAITAQNTLRVSAVHAVPVDILRAQLDAVYTDIRPDVVKIGMVASAELIVCIAQALRQYQPQAVVLDPVMISTSGAALLPPAAQNALVRELLPLADIVTPNLAEAAALTGMTVATREDMVRAAHALAAMTHGAVLVKGGHLADVSDDLLLHAGKLRWFSGTRVDNPNTHGTGCTLSSAIAAGLCYGKPLEDAMLAAKQYVTDALAWGLDLGQGSGPLCHMARLL